MKNVCKSEITAPVSVCIGEKSDTHTQCLQLLSQPSHALQNAAIENEVALNEQLGSLKGNLQPASGDPTELLIANSLWTNGVELKPAYVQHVSALYEATAAKATSVDVINEWAAKVTKGLIREAIPRGTDFAAALVNAIYFKGMWEHKFDKANTSPHAFTTGAGKQKNVPTMSRTFKHSEEGRKVAVTGVEGQYAAVRLPYQGGSFSAIALLPVEGSSPQQLLGTVDVAQLLEDSAWQAVPMLHLQMPKFKLQSQVSLKDALQSQGVTAPFQQDADFSRLSDDRVYISNVIHTAVVEVDEEGSEAAAVTAVMMPRSLPPKPAEMIIDRPFIFMIAHDPSKTPLFLGVVHDPEQQS